MKGCLSFASAALLAAVTATVSAEVAPWSGLCMVQVPQDFAFLADYTADPPTQRNLRVGDRLGSGQGVLTLSDNRVMIHLSAGPEDAPAAEAGIYLDAESGMVLGPAEVGFRRIQVNTGRVLIHYRARDGGVLVVMAGQSWVRLVRGALLVTVAADQTAEPAKFAAVEAATEAWVFRGEPPADPRTAAGGQPLAVDVNARPLAAGLREVLQTAMAAGLPERWVNGAEGGDLIPAGGGEANLTRGGVEVRLQPTQASAAGIGKVAAAVATILPPVSTSTIGGTGVSTTRLLLTSGNPASVVVGSRLERARVSGETRAGVRANPLVRPPLRLSE